jgi:hypothetical protein
MAAQPPSGAPASSGGAPRSDRGTAALVKDVVGNTQTLVRGELELARLELMEGLQAKGQAAGMAGAAGMVGLYVVGFLGLALGAGLGEMMPAWAGWLITAGVFLLVLVILLLMARSRANAAPLSPDKTKARVQEDLAWAKTLIRR